MNKYHESTRKVEAKLEEVFKTQDLIGLLDTELKASEQENRVLKEQLLQQESYTRRDNLLFLGIQEQHNENSEETVRTLLRSSLGLSDETVKTILISRCHRVGKKKSSHPRPIIARFLIHSQKMWVWQKRFTLKETPYLIKEDFPREIQNRRKLMLPLYNEAKRRDRTTKIVGERVTYRGRSYSYPQASQLASELKFFESGQSKRNGRVAFFGCSALYSNFYPATFQDGATTYTCSEQLYQQQLCLHFADAQAARAVLLQTDPVEMKKIGDRVLKSNQDEQTRWYNTQARDVMKNAVRLKFQQNPVLCDVLKNSTGQFIEANRYDSTWGVGLSLKDDKIWTENTWKGTNWLGQILDELKVEL